MLEFIPRPEQDELLYSMVARGVVMAGRSAAPQILAACTGNANGMVGVDLPFGIDRMLAALPEGSPHDCTRYVEQHTMFPYMLRFARPLTVARVRTALQHGSARRPAKLGVMAWAFPVPAYLRACPACIRADTTEAGMPWWRRAHQLPGVYVCPIHGTSLHRTAVPRLGMRGAAGLIALNSSLPIEPDVILPSGPQRATFVCYARASARLLDPDWPVKIDPATLAGRLRELLADFKWSRAPSLLDAARLVRAFMSHARIRPMLRAMGVELTAEQLGTGLNRLLYGHGDASHPLLVLIILELTGSSLADLEVVQGPGQPAAATSQMQSDQGVSRSVISYPRTLCLPGDAKAVDDRESDDGLSPMQPRGGADGESVHGQPARKLGGAGWDRLLMDLVSGGASVRAISRQLGIAPTSVQRHARRLGVWRSEWVDRPKLQSRAADRPRVLLEQHRAAWLSYRQGPHSTAKNLPKTAFNAYRYLMRHDRAWLMEHSPLRRPPATARVDWAARDREMCNAAMEVIARWSMSDSPTKVSVTSVGRALQAYSVVVGNKDRLPELHRLIQELHYRHRLGMHVACRRLDHGSTPPAGSNSELGTDSII